MLFASDYSIYFIAKTKTNANKYFFLFIKFLFSRKKFWMTLKGEPTVWGLVAFASFKGISWYPTTIRYFSLNIVFFDMGNCQMTYITAIEMWCFNSDNRFFPKLFLFHSYNFILKNIKLMNIPINNCVTCMNYFISIL